MTGESVTGVDAEARGGIDKKDFEVCTLVVDKGRSTR